MTDDAIIRRYTFKLYPSVAQTAELHTQRMMMADLWNALLEQRERASEGEMKPLVECFRSIDDQPSQAVERLKETKEQRLERLKVERESRAERRRIAKENGTARTLTFFDQASEMKGLRRVRPEWAALSVWSAQRVARSLDEAFSGFFRRVRAGDGPAGYPRYRKRRTAVAIPHRFASGCKLSPALGERSDGTNSAGRSRNWRLYLKGITGLIRARGQFPAEALAWKDADVLWRDGAWWASACIEMEPRRAAGTDEITIRLNLIDEFARVERVSGPRRASAASARAQAGNPNHLNILRTGSGSDDPAGSDERASHRETDQRRTASGSDGPAGSDERVDLGAQGRHDLEAGSDGPADSDERALHRARAAPGKRAGSDDPADSDERAILAAATGRDLLRPGSDDPADSDERAELSANSPGDRLHAGSDDPAGSDERASSGPRQHDPAGSDERATRRKGSHSVSDDPASSNDSGSDERAKLPRSTPGLDDPAGSDERGVAAAASDRLAKFMAASAELVARADAVKSARDLCRRRRSRRWIETTRRAGRLTARAARIRREALHVWSSRLMAAAGTVTVITPAVRSVTKSPRGNERQWGAAVEAVSNLNRNTLNQAPAMAVQMLAYKAKEAGIRCDVVADVAPDIAVGEKLVAASKAVRRSKRAMKG